MKLLLPGSVAVFLKMLENTGYEAYVVGGCVRDSLLGREPADWDVCTNANPNEIMACFDGHKVIPTGVKHGTVTVIIDGRSVEITTYRTDGPYQDHRRPESVHFTGSLKDDLARRDFTVNAMAYSLNQELVDPFGGQDDLQKGILRCVGEPLTRFGEDALRILRLFRFSAQLNFVPDGDTLSAAKRRKADLIYVSNERVAAEMSKLIMCPTPEAALKMMSTAGVLQEIIPEFAPCVGFVQHTRYHHHTVDQHTFAAVEAIPPKLYLRLTMLLHDLAKPGCFTLDSDGVGHFKGHDTQGAKLAEEVLKRLRFDNTTIRKVTRLVALHDCEIPKDTLGFRRMIARLGVDMFPDLLEVKLADTKAKNPQFVQTRLKDLEKAKNLFDNIIAQNLCLSLKDLAVNGDDLYILGLRGPNVGRALDILLDLVIDDPSRNTREILMPLAKDMISRENSSSP